ncbi:MAG: Hpt domain-containing protein [Lachnospiraceae bacterium]|nr:Hpt domain-containing protein [Lachnospiraceae bacterium]
MRNTLYVKMMPYLEEEERLLERMAGHLDLWEECVRIFSKEEIVEKMDKALEEKDFQAFQAYVHRLKGSLANFGFERAARKATEILRMIEEKDTEQILCQYGNLREEYVQIIERIKEA